MFCSADNTKAHSDTNIKQLMGLIISTAQHEAFTKLMVIILHLVPSTFVTFYFCFQIPLEWLQVLDMLDKKKTQRVTHMTRNDFEAEALRCGVVKDDMDCLLFYLNQLGEALWVNTVALRDLVILVRWLLCCLLRNLTCIAAGCPVGHHGLDRGHL